MADKDFKSLTKYEKVASRKENFVCKVERSTYCEYFIALWKNDTAKIDFIEQFGDRLTQIIQNYRNFKRAVSLGYEMISFNKYGWFIEPKIQVIDEILIYKHKKDFALGNEISIGVSANGKYLFGCNFMTENTGSSHGINIWGDSYDTPEKAINEACVRMIKFHERAKGSYSKAVIKAANEKIQEVKGNRPVQLELNFCA